MRTEPVRRVVIPFGSAYSARRPPLNVGIVTDDAATADACERALRREGHTVRVARHGGHAHLLCVSGERLDVLLVELVMPDVSGPTLMRRLRRHHPGLECVYLAGPGSRCDADNVLVRPFTADDLLGRLRSVLASTA